MVTDSRSGGAIPFNSTGVTNGQVPVYNSTNHDWEPGTVSGSPTLPSTGTAGAPTAGTWSTGQEVYDSHDRIWLCTAGGTPGTWVLKDNLGSPVLIDLCAPPYSCVAGTDITTALQNAINDAVTSGLDTALFFSQPGVYDINGAVSSGTDSNGYAYAGQILFPARSNSSPITIRILGCTPTAGNYFPSTAVNANGTVLLSNAASGSIFDCKTGFLATNGWPFTAIKVVFEDICVRGPSNPQCGGINGQALLQLTFRGTVRVDTNETPSTSMAARTGSGYGVIMPGPDNGTFSSQFGEMQIAGWPNGIAHSEHFSCDYLSIRFCNTAVSIYGGNTYHASKYKQMSIGACITYFKAWTGNIGSTAGGIISGYVTTEVSTSGNFTFANMISDSGNVLLGRLDIYCATAGGWPVVGAANLNWARADIGGLDWMSRFPHDDLGRVSTPSGNLGTCDATGHPWQTTSGTLTISGGAFVATALGGGNSEAIAVTPYNKQRPGLSRIIHASITTGSSGYFVGLVAAMAYSTGNFLYVVLTGGQVLIKKSVSGTESTLATSSAGVVAASTTYKVDVVINNPTVAGNALGSYTVTVYINGTSAVSYTLTGTDIADVGDSNTETRTQDGIRIADLVSSIGGFRVLPQP